MFFQVIKKFLQNICVVLNSCTFAADFRNVDMDKYRINFKCNKTPKANLGLEGYEPDKQYAGRTFNGVFEIAPNWGKDFPTRMLDGKIFFEYFELIDN